MRVAVEHNTEGVSRDLPRPRAVDPTAPDLSFLARDPKAALRSFFSTIDEIVGKNAVDAARLHELVSKMRAGTLSGDEGPELQALKALAVRQGRAVAATIGFFLKFKPYAALEEVRARTKVFQPRFGPLLVVDGDTVRDVLERNQEFTVEPYGVEMARVMSPRHNGGFHTFILSTDANPAYEPDKKLLSLVCNRQDAERITTLIHQDCVRRTGQAIQDARESGRTTIDVVQNIARYVPVTLGHHYLGVPVEEHAATFELSDDMLSYYGQPIDEQPDTALRRSDGVIPDERQMYGWIKAAFQHFFNNVQKDPLVQAQGFRACRQLLAYLLREIDIQRTHLLSGEPVADTMLTRLLGYQMGRSIGPARPPDLDPRLVSDLRIAENVMGTIVGAVAGQEEATSRTIDSLIRLKEGEYSTSGSSAHRYGSFDEARALALNVMNGVEVGASRAVLHAYFQEALRLQPQGEVLLRKCSRDGVRIADGEPISAGTLVFASHGSAMKDVPEPDAFILNRPPEHYLQYGWGRHTCLGQYVSPVIIVETMVALLALEDLRRPAPAAGETAAPFERRTGHLQLDDQNLYATTFMLQFTDSGSTRQFYPAEIGTEVM
jgi:cytochrome P450